MGLQMFKIELMPASQRHTGFSLDGFYWYLQAINMGVAVAYTLSVSDIVVPYVHP
jgi:hypothetical protein